MQDSPERSVSPYRGGGGTPALAPSFLPVALLLAQRRGHIAGLVALVGQILVERQHRPQLGDRGPPRRHVVLADVRQLPVGGAVRLGVAAAAWRRREEAVHSSGSLDLTYVVKSNSGGIKINRLNFHRWNIQSSPCELLFGSHLKAQLLLVWQLGHELETGSGAERSCQELSDYKSSKSINFWL